MEPRKMNFFVKDVKEVEYNCPIHGRVIAKRMSFEGETVTTCPLCEKEREEKEREKQRQAQKKAAYETKVRDCNIEPEYWYKTLDDFIPTTPSQAKAKEAAAKMIASKTGKIVLLGANGVGKTMLGSIVVSELGGKIYSMYEITTMIRSCYTARAEKTELELVKELANLPMLVIDELGRTKGSDAELNWLSFILDKRHVRKLPFMILSNTHLKRTCKNGGCSNCFENYVNNDVLSRLRENTEIVTIEAADYRAKK